MNSILTIHFLFISYLQRLTLHLAQIRGPTKGAPPPAAAQRVQVRCRVLIPIPFSRTVDSRRISQHYISSALRQNRLKQQRAATGKGTPRSHSFEPDQTEAIQRTRKKAVSRPPPKQNKTLIYFSKWRWDTRGVEPVLRMDVVQNIT